MNKVWGRPSNFSETTIFRGFQTIRAFGWADHFKKTGFSHLGRKGI